MHIRIVHWTVNLFEIDESVYTFKRPPINSLCVACVHPSIQIYIHTLTTLNLSYFPPSLILFHSLVQQRFHNSRAQCNIALTVIPFNVAGDGWISVNCPLWQSKWKNRNKKIPTRVKNMTVTWSNNDIFNRFRFISFHFFFSSNISSYIDQ